MLQHKSTKASQKVARRAAAAVHRIRAPALRAAYTAAPAALRVARRRSPGNMISESISRRRRPRNVGPELFLLQYNRKVDFS